MDTKKTILVVDDSETNVLLISNILELAGYNIISAFNGKEAFSVVEERMPDLILLDLMMPYLNGFKFLEKIKSHGKLKSIPVFVITAKLETTELQKAIKLGAAGCMAKPIKINRLKEIIAELLGLS